jgi:ribonucleotide reductase beta subunit family protein with ferritin-like domain
VPEDDDQQEGPCRLLNAPYRLGIERNYAQEYLYFIASRRCQQVRVDPTVDEADNQFPWMAEMIHLKREKDSLELCVG